MIPSAADTRKKRSRWGDAKTDIPGLPTAISAAGVSQAQLDNYAIHLRLEEINRKLRLNDFIPPERERFAFILVSPTTTLILPSLDHFLHHPLTTPTGDAPIPVRSVIGRSWRMNAFALLIAP
jgi:hypothetical protein